MWRLFLGLALALAAAAAEPPAHPGVPDPAAFLRNRYAEYRSGETSALALDTYASERLRAHLHAHDAAAGGEEMDSLDWWVDGIDRLIAEVRLTRRPDAGPGRQAITARFRNAGRPVGLIFHFVREHGAWYLDEVVKPGPRGWTLTGRLAMRPAEPPRP